MEENNKFIEEEEIGLSLLFAEMLRKWRTVILTAVILGVLAAALQAFRGYRNLNDPKFMEENEKNYNRQISAYENSVERLNTDIDNLENSIEKQKRYLTNAPIMIIDPYNVHRKNVTWFLSTDYQIMPGMAYQNPDMTLSILNAYRGIAQDVSEDVLGETFAFETDEDWNSDLLSQLMTIRADAEDQTLSVTISADTEERAEQILTAVISAVEENKDMITKAMGEHELSVIRRMDRVIVDTALDERQQNESNKLSTMQANLANKTDELAELEKPKVSLWNFKAIIKSAVKFGILAAVLGGALACFWVCVRFVMSGTLHSAQSLKNCFEEPVIGRFPRKGEDKNFFERLAASLEGPGTTAPYDRAMAAAAANVRNHAGSCKKILVCGGASPESISSFSASLQAALPECRFTAGGDLLQDADTINLLMEQEAVILAEERERSVVSEIMGETEEVERLGKKLIGFAVF